MLVAADLFLYHREDRVKAQLYARLGIAEYFLYDPEGEYLRPPLQGFRLAGDGYRPIAERADGSLRSERLDLDLRIDGRWFELFETGTGERLLRGSEAAKAEALRRDAAQHERGKAQRERDAAQRRAEALTAEVDRLRSSMNRGGDGA